MIDALITSKTRIKLLFKFFFNPDVTSYLRELAEEFGESTNAVRLELNRFTEAGLINSAQQGRTRMYGANQNHPLFPEIHALVRKTLGIDQMIERVLGYLGDLEAVYIIGDYARGVDSGIIDLVLVGNVDKANLQGCVEKAEDLVKRKIRPLVLSRQEREKLDKTLDLHNSLLLWKR